MIQFSNPELTDIVIYTNLHAALSALPKEYPVQKGDILEATPLADHDPVFRQSEIVIFGINSHGSIQGTSLKRGHPAYGFEATWSLEGLKEEMDMGVWKKSSSLEGSVSEYFNKLNQQ